ncbi:MAG: DUF1826 domain-containing protein [Pseudomonadota bacterium]
MTRHEAISAPQVDGVVTGPAPRALAAIAQPDCAASIWAREPLARFQSWIDALNIQHLPRARLILRPGAVRQVMEQLADAQGLPPSDERTMLIDDIAALAHIFASVMDAPFLRLRLDVIATNACHKFHADVVTARLICTYRGAGTQYGVSVHGEDPARVFTAPAGSPIVFRGHLWPPVAAPQLLHRSPPIEGTGETRLVLVLDPITDPDHARRQEFLH